MSARISLEPLSLTRVGTTALYIESGTVPAGEGFASYWVASLPASPDATITPKRAWDDPEYRGHFVFLLKAPSDPAAFATALQASGVLPDPARTSFAWVRYDDVKGVTGANLLELKTDGRDVVATDADYQFANYGYPLFAGSPVDVERDGIGEPLRFLVAYPPLPKFPAPNTRINALPLYDRGRFCLRHDQALINDFGVSRETGSDVSFHYSAIFREKLVNFRYPLIAAPPGGAYHLLFSVQWDPLGARAPARTELVFRNAAYLLITTGGKDPVSEIVPVANGEAFPTYFRTVYDEQLGLRARLASETSNPGKLVFDVYESDGVEKYYLTPAGEFEFTTPPTIAPRVLADDDGRRKVICGLSGIESFDCRIRSAATPRGDIVLFTPYQPAYAPVFPLTGGGQSELLEPKYTTSWMTVYRNGTVGGDPPYYQSQADSAPLFHQQTANAAILGFYNSETLILDAPAVAKAAPMVPYAGVQADTELTAAIYSSFEAEIISPSRITAITAVPPEQRTVRAASAATIRTTTPQGFLADITGTVWNRVQLARSVTSTGTTSLEFQNLGAALRDALQTNELFLVCTNPEPLGTFLNTIAIADWPFSINVGKVDQQGSFTNVLIFKFGQGTVEQRVKDTASWTNPAVFTKDNARGVSFWLQAYIAETEQLARDDARYTPFLDLVRSPTWNGVIALRVDVKTQAFPADIKGLLGGIDLSRFYGHHIGINVNLVKTGGGLELSNRSSLFGLINYIAKNDAPSGNSTSFALRSAAALAQPAPEGVYSFRVLTLQVVFTNSEIVDFNSKIILTITKWFGDAVELQGFADDPVLRNSILLFGSYENHNGIPFYTFQGTGRFRFVAASQVLGYVEIVKAQFHTMKDGNVNPIEGEELVRSLFSLWGYVSFLPVPDLDTLSFGNDAGDTTGITRGLYCSDIGILMSFVLVEDQQPVPEFVFDAARMGFDLTLSYARPESLFRKFPFRVTRIESSDGDRSPTDAGYLPVVTPALKTVPLQKDWYGLYLALNLGSMGALAENAGFDAGILAAWSPSPNRASASVLMRIPGTGSGKTQLSLQSVLRLGINRIELVEQTKNSGYYLLNLTNIGLFFLGKKLPPSGATNITIFSSDGVSSDSNLAWYAAYYDPATPNPPLNCPPPRLPLDGQGD
jgi:hypothetical protein